MWFYLSASVLILQSFDCLPQRNFRSDFVFPDETQPNGVPQWALKPSNRPAQQNFRPPTKPPINFGTPTKPIFNFGTPTKPPINFPSVPNVVTPLPNFPKKPTPPSKMGARTTPSEAFFICLQRCPVTSEYNPICGTNQQLYHNLSKFTCAQRCGSDVQLVRQGTCRGLFPMTLG